MENSSHQRRRDVRRLLDSFEAAGPNNKRVVLVFEVAQVSLKGYEGVVSTRWIQGGLCEGAYY